ncbi:hypothetical protein P5704_020855 [Pseudomonas sp. FeN3W]|jgi:hypothetical protein|uniref:GPI inositol-deacylase PGAP1-like alpha/beta domain-containing protein n=1 Tax=Stutzerimonas stutzeri NF13 TaxID=1212548 RepID=M2V2G2_STUST|nr:hypothetical protein [Stutzerimonas stutzeri]EMD99991.1 hypothetical protein B381_11276 [Stutzerimonas stutzeri NF13]MCQ4290023.1 hypothetical protein [Stutzerimonas stutzeri]WOF78432.1 hypothetical protein P5704_020855 [Pseudomonas sp. FeN3W]
MALRYPIIYIRGYAMTTGERNETAADPFCGFNVGSTVYRALDRKDRPTQKLVFESPVVRLMSEFQYQHVYQDGYDIMDPCWEPARDEEGKPIPGIAPASIVILRYYDDGSDFFGDGKARHITEYARRLNELILKVRQRVAEYQEKGKAVMPEENFRCYLVAHSMGGLVARAFLQGAGEYSNARATVDKLFTIATPHNGIDVGGRFNVPSWLTAEEVDTFNRKKMAEYLNLTKVTAQFDNRVDLIPRSALPPERIFCMVGTNRGDYEPLHGAVRAFVGNGSDGLVRIDNASLWGINTDASGNLIENSHQEVATAYAFRSHSGYYGIVNSEESYQNLVRFLFGDVRVDIHLEIEKVSLPVGVEQAIVKGETLEAGYQFEFLATPKGKRWFLTRRQSVEDSPACRSHQELTSDGSSRKSIYLSSVFLSKWAKVDESPCLTYKMSVAAKVPDYVVGGRFWRNEHFEGADLFRDEAIVHLTPPEHDGGEWQIDLAWAVLKAKRIKQKLLFDNEHSCRDILLPFNQDGRPGIKGSLRLRVQPWK